MLVGAAIAVGAAAFLVWMFWGWIAFWIWGQASDAPMTAAPAHQFTMGVPLQQQAPPPPPDIATRAPAPPPKVAAAAAPAPPPPPADIKPATLRPMVVWQASNLPGMGMTEAAKRPATAGTDDDDNVGGSGTLKDTAYAKAMATTRIDNERPTPHRFPPHYTIAKGTVFSCTPPMPISTEIPGPLWCDVDHDILSEDGDMILIPAHSRVNGMIERGLGLGQNRAVIVFTDILTAGPDFLPIPLTAASGASDIGQNGVPVDVNEHTWEKLKTTLMFAGIEGLTSFGTAALQGNKGNTQYNFGTMNSVPTSLAQIAFQHDMNIPTTGYRGPGKSIAVYVNNYIDLSKYYSATLRRGR
jgi:type IV secretory pathway VirB10-like protein